MIMEDTEWLAVVTDRESLELLGIVMRDDSIKALRSPSKTRRCESAC
jgi:predicted transcriptional regulator